MTPPPKTPEDPLAQARAAFRRGDLKAAERLLSQRLRAAPQDSAALALLGAAKARRGDLKGAAEALERAVALAPRDAAARFNLGNVYRQLGRHDDAVATLQQAAVAAPKSVEALTGLAAALKEAGRMEEAEAACRRALAVGPGHAPAHDTLGTILKDAGRLEDAEAALRTALRYAPRHGPTLSNLGNVLSEAGRLEAAVGVYREALAADPKNADTLFNLGRTVFNLGDRDEAERRYREALSLRPDHYQAAQNLLFAACAHPDRSATDLLAMHREWGERMARRVGDRARRTHANAPDPGRTLRVGYLSADFREHVVARFLEPILASHDPGAVTTYCYASVARPDARTERLKGLVPHWRDVAQLADDAVADRIAADGIDLLVELGGHTRGSRLPALAYRPAPVQASYLGYPATTGLKAVGWRLADPWTDPEDVDPQTVERIQRIEGGFCCYLPPDDAPDPGPPPAQAAGHVTFGSLNNVTKINERAIARWAEIMRAVPDSRLLLRRAEFEWAVTRKRFVDTFTACGIPPERVLCESGRGVDSAGFMATYGRIDIGLDTFPYAGHTTTCESLWMGVPTVTLAGDAYIGRVGVSLMHMVGLEELVASDSDAYVATAVRLAKDLPALARMRAGLRERMRASVLCDGPGFTRRLEEAYRHMWQAWCAAKGGA